MDNKVKESIKVLRNKLKEEFINSDSANNAKEEDIQLFTLCLKLMSGIEELCDTVNILEEKIKQLEVKS